MKPSPLTRKTPLTRSSSLRRGAPPTRRTTLARVSKKRLAENRVRLAACRAAFGTDPACARCGAPAWDAHEIVPRSKGGSITDTSNIRPVCRPCHDWIHNSPADAKAEGWLA